MAVPEVWQIAGKVTLLSGTGLGLWRVGHPVAAAVLVLVGVTSTILIRVLDGGGSATSWSAPA